MAGVAKQPGQRQSNSHIVALLSLKILLLAFFILLNALATFEDDRRTAVVDSVRQAFQGLLPARLNLDRSPAALDVFEGAEEVIDRLHRLFADDLPIVERRESAGNRTLRVDMPVADLFAADGEALMPEGAETLRLVARALADPRLAPAGYRIDLLYGLGGASGRTAAVARAGAMVRELERQGLAPGRLSTGLLPDFGGRVRIHFTIMPEAAAPGAEG
jgi:hypothetical protein